MCSEILLHLFATLKSTEILFNEIFAETAVLPPFGALKGVVDKIKTPYFYLSLTEATDNKDPLLLFETH